MRGNFPRWLLIGAGIGICAYVAYKYLLPAVIPFLLGGAVALAAEPLVALGCGRLRMKRGLAAGVGVTVTLALLAGLLWLLGALAVRELMTLAERMPDIQVTARQGSEQLQEWLTHVAQSAPRGVRNLLRQTVTETFDGGQALMDQAAERLPTLAAGLLSWIPKGTVTLFTAVLAAFLISARMPVLRSWVRRGLEVSWVRKGLGGLSRVRHALGGWLKAQCKLALVTWAVVGVGFLLLRIPYGILWALPVAVVDAVPVLGTGTVLVPWSLVCFLQGDIRQGVGLLCVYGVALITRTVLEPRLVGQQLGLDPLVTLGAFYLGFTLWGVGGMLLAPVLAAGVSAVLRQSGEGREK